MIRFVTRTFFSLIALAALTGTAQAAFVPATWMDDYVTNQEVSVGSPAEYFHDITFDGFNVGHDLVTDFLLTIDLYDDESDKRFEGELAFVDIPGVLGDRFVSNFQFGDGAYAGASLVGIFELNLLGQLSVTVSSLYGDFVLTGSHLVANGLQQVASVPEPGTLGLLGLGLLGIAAGTRRRSSARG
jgi:hypothetical protein